MKIRDICAIKQMGGQIDTCKVYERHYTFSYKNNFIMRLKTGKK